MTQVRKRAGRIIDGDAAFLLRINRDLFFVKFDGKGDPLGVAIPSVAAHFSYKEADALCQQIKTKGYNGPWSRIFGDAWQMLLLSKLHGSHRKTGSRNFGEIPPANP